MLHNKRVVLSLHYNWTNSFLTVNATKIYQLKAKKSEIKSHEPCLDNTSKNYTFNGMKKIGVKGVVKFFSVDFNPIDTSLVLDI